MMFSNELSQNKVDDPEVEVLVFFSGCTQLPIAIAREATAISFRNRVVFICCNSLYLIFDDMRGKYRRL